MKPKLHQLRLVLAALSFLSFIIGNSLSAFAHTVGKSPQAVSGLVSPVTGSPINLPNHGRDLVAQAAASGGAGQIDLAPVKLPDRSGALGNLQALRTGVLYRLPGRMFFNVNVENTLRLETNVFQTLRNNRVDMIYRVLPNVTLGYALDSRTRVAANYFFLRDQYTHYSQLMSRDFHSVGFRIDRDIPLTGTTTSTVSFFARQLFIPQFDELSDLIPSISLVRRVGQRGAVYSNILGQVRFRDFLGRFQEFDQFYSLGGIYRLPLWTFLVDNTFITNFGNSALRGGPNNAVMVMTLEAGRKVHPVLPMTAFIRAESIFNIGANQSTGFAGVNFRIFGGLRVEVGKPPIFPVRIRRG